MIAKAKSISHGINDIRYITGETENKEHPECIFHVKDNLLHPRLDATGDMGIHEVGSRQIVEGEEHSHTHRIESGAGTHEGLFPRGLAEVVGRVRG